MARLLSFFIVETTVVVGFGPVVLGSTYCIWSLSSITFHTISLMFPLSRFDIVEMLDIFILYHRCSCSCGDRCPCVELIFVDLVVGKYGRDKLVSEPGLGTPRALGEMFGDRMIMSTIGDRMPQSITLES